jgi:tetratricopeptide (TPR) repeat protein
LVAVTLLVFAQTLNFDFAKVDDTFYVTRNAHVLSGLSASNVAWAFRSFEASNWHPLTWISLMIDAMVGGGRPWAFHATNLAFHTANALLLFHLLFTTTRSSLKSAFVAALFAIHPLHVESVAWVTERKDVLSTFFWFLAMLSHVAYARRPSAMRYAAVVAFFVLGALSKPMVVSLPLTLLLLDFWPLERLRGWTQVTEKVPLLVLSVVLSVVTLVAQSSASASLAAVPVGARITGAIVAYATYAAKMLYPSDLSIHYVLADAIPAWKTAMCALGLAGATWLAIAERTRHRFVTFGWLWYVVTLIPVVGFIPVGEQSVADRYTYVPLIGLFVVAAWGVPDLLAAVAPAGLATRRLLVTMASLVIAALAVRAHDQAKHWRDGFELFRHAVAVNGRNTLARMGLAQELAARGRDAEAIAEYREVLRLRPDALFARQHLAESLERTGQIDAASAEFREMLRIDPENAEASLGLGVLLMEAQKPAEALEVLGRAMRSRPTDSKIHMTMGLALTRLERYGEAEAAFEAALRADPGNLLAHKGIAIVLARTGRTDEAIAHLRQVLEADPAQADARENLARLLLRQGKPAEAEAVRKGGR